MPGAIAAPPSAEAPAGELDETVPGQILELMLDGLRVRSGSALRGEPITSVALDLVAPATS